VARSCLRLPLTIGLLMVTPLLAGRALAQDPRTGPHVRTDDATLRRLMERGLKQSPTLRELVKQIDQLPGLVYLVPSRCGVLSELSACLDHDVKVRGGYRFLRVNVMPGDPAFRQLPLLAHELQHAVEVLSDDSATSQEAVTRLYERIGVRKGVGNFETEAAQRVQETVVGELREAGGR
jgi:hypothetical protein